MSNAKVLIVDDDETVRLVACEMLSILQCDVSAASSAAEALDILKLDEFDLLLLDVGMPVMSGVELFQLIRERTPSQPIAFISGYAEEDLSEHLDGYTHVVPKPFSIATLTDVIARSLPRA